MIKLQKHQQDSLDAVSDKDNVAFYLACGLGKTFVGSEQMKKFGNSYNVVVCPKSLISMWVDHFKRYYPNIPVNDFTKSKKIQSGVTVVNYDLIWRRKEFLELSDFTLLLDESSKIANETTKRSKFILKLRPKNAILLSGTPVSGKKYEKLWSQCSLLGWYITKKAFYDRYVISVQKDMGTGFPITIVVGYKNVEELKQNLRKNGAYFLTAEEVLDLPDQTYIPLSVENTKTYKQFKKDKIVTVNNKELVGDSIFSQMLYERQLCSQFNKNKLEAFSDLIESSDDRWIVFYNFNDELELLKKVIGKRPLSVVNGKVKDLRNYEKHDDSVTLIQYQAGSHGLTLTKANKMIYFSPPLSTELWMQSGKRIHRMSQNKKCLYYQLITKDSIEEKIYLALKNGVDYTENLFREDI